MLSNDVWKQGPMWARPKMPFEDIISGARSGGGFNPGGAFMGGTKAMPSAPPQDGGGYTPPSSTGPTTGDFAPGANMIGGLRGNGGLMQGGMEHMPTITNDQAPMPGNYTLPSLQRWNKLAPSEQAMQQGIWQDEGQLHTPDILNLMNKLRPNTASSFAPRWMS